MITAFNVFQVQRLLMAGSTTTLNNHFQAIHREFEQERLSGTQLMAHYECLDVERRAVQQGLEQWVDQCPNDYTARYALGNFHLLVGWRARGIRTSNHTAGRQFEVMNQHFEQGLPYLYLAVEANPRPYAALCAGIILETGGCHALTGSFVEQAKSYLPHSQSLCETFMWAMQPKWGGEDGALEDFYRRTQRFDWNAQEHDAMAAYYHRMEADALCCEGEYGQALSCLLPWMEKFRHPALLCAVGNLHVRRDEHAVAVRCYEEAARIRPRANTFEDLANALEATGDTAGAQRANESGAELGNGDCAAKLAYALRPRMGEPESAIAARHWCDLGAEQYSGSAMFERAAHHCLGLGTQKNPQEALRLWGDAGEWGNWTALDNCVNTYWEGSKWVRKDPVRARHYAALSAGIRNPDGMGSYGIMLSRGHGGAKDYEAALPWLYEASHEDHVGAMGWFVRALWYGHGTPVDRVTARQWLQRLKKVDAEEGQETRSEIFGLVGWSRSFWGQLRSSLLPRSSV